MKKKVTIFTFLFVMNSFANCYYDLAGSISSCESISPTKSYVVVNCIYGTNSRAVMGGCMDSIYYPPETWNLYICAGHGVNLSKTCPTVAPALTYNMRHPNQTGKSCGSIVHVDNQVLSERVFITGVNYSLNYSSQRVPGRKDWYEINIPITASNFVNNGHYTKTTLKATIAGQVINTNFPSPAAGQFYNFSWDGKDSLGNDLTGSHPLAIEIGGEYDNVVTTVLGFPEYNVNSKTASNPSQKKITTLPDYVVAPTESNVFLGSVFSEVMMGGWSFSVHHKYDPVRKILYLGDGTTFETGHKVDSSGNYLIVSSDREDVYVFDSTFKHLSTKDGLTGLTKLVFSYNSNNDLVAISDAYGNSTTVQYSGTDIISITSPYGEVTQIDTDLNGYISSIVNPASEEYEMTYSSDGLLLTFEKPNGVISTMTYDSKGLLVSDTSSAGSELNFSRTQADNSVTITETSATGLVKTHKIDNAAVYNRRTTYPNSYYDNYNLNTGGQENISNTMSFGSYRTFKNDNRFGSPLRMLDFYRITDGGVNPMTSFSETFSLSNPSDPFSFSVLSTTLTTNSLVKKIDYTKATKKKEFVTSLNRKVATYLNNQGDTIYIQTAGLLPVNFSYDINGRVDYISQGTRSTSFTYNSLGRLDTIENSLGQTSSYTYDLAGRVVSTTLPDLRVINYSYDSNGNLTSVTPPSKPSHSMIYNGFDSISSYLPPTIAAPSSLATTYYYDDDRRLLQITRPSGQSIQQNYHATNGNLTSTTLPSGVRTYSYTNGVVTSSLSEDLYSSTFNYKGSLPGSSNISKGTFSYTSTNNYNSTNILPSSEALSVKTYSGTINYSYDNDDLLSAAGDQTFTRDTASGVLTKISLGSVSRNFTYTTSTYGELSSINGKYLTGDIYNEVLVRDDLGRISSSNEQYGTGPYVLSEYLYDSAGRLTDVETGGVVTSHYDYDSNSNRISQTIGGVTTTATYDDQDRLLTFGTKSFSYNLNGDLVEMTDSSTSSTYQYTYDVIGNLKSVALPSKTVNYEVDSKDRRMVKKSGTTVENYFIWNNFNQLVGVTDSSGVLLSRFVYGSSNHVPDYMIQGTNKFQIITNHLGSPVVVVNTATGVVAQEVKYDDFGNIISDTNPGFTPFGFAGCLYDQDTKLCRFGARDYDASIGRWLSKDPILFAGGDTNLYGYVMQDPINLIDPSGLEATLYIAPPYHAVLGVTNPNSLTGMTYGHFYPSGNSIGLLSPTQGKVGITNSYPGLIPLRTYSTTPAQDQQILQNMQLLRNMANNGSYPYSAAPPFTGALTGQDSNNCFGFASKACGGACQ